MVLLRRHQCVWLSRALSHSRCGPGDSVADNGILSSALHWGDKPLLPIQHGHVPHAALKHSVSLQGWDVVFYGDSITEE